MKPLPKNRLELDGDIAARFGIKLYPGYLSAFTRREAVGAFRNGTRIVKVREDHGGDWHGVSSSGIVLGSISHAELGIAYFVEWDDRPKLPSIVVAAKIRIAP